MIESMTLAEFLERLPPRATTSLPILVDVEGSDVYVDILELKVELISDRLTLVIKTEAIEEEEDDEEDDETESV